jgi:hypothetical protein
MFCILQLLCECLSCCCSFNCVPNWLNCTEIMIIWLQLYVCMTKLLWELSLNNLKKLFFDLVIISAYVIFCKPFLYVSFTECHSLSFKKRLTKMCCVLLLHSLMEYWVYAFPELTWKRFRVYFIVIIASLLSFLFSSFILFCFIYFFHDLKKPS